MRTLNLSDGDVLALVENLDKLNLYTYHSQVFTGNFIQELRSLELKIRKEQKQKE